MFFRNAAILSLFALAAWSPLRAERVFAIDSRAVLVSFDSEKPGAILSMAVVRGLQPGESVLGLDFRPANKRLYALGSSSQIYVVDIATGQATRVGTRFLPLLDGTKFGFSFNPTVDRIRITSNRGQNLRVHPDTGAMVAVDGTLRYTDDATPNVVSSGYTNSVAGATTTQLMNFDLSRRAVVIQNPPNDGVLTVRFQVRMADASEVSGFDISAATGKAYLATRETANARVQLYELDLANGTATLSGTVGMLDQVSAISVAPAGEFPTLFSRLGGLDAISAVVDQFLSNVVADNRINKFFSATVASPARVAALRQNLIDQVCEGSGGPCQYKGADMKSAHRGMMISDVEFDALVEDLALALDKFNVPATEKAALVGILGPMRADIVEKKQMQMLAR